MTSARLHWTVLLLAAPVSFGCLMAGAHAMPMGASQAAPPPPDQAGQPDRRAPSVGDQGLQVGASDAMPQAMGSPQAAPAQADTNEMAAEMKGLGAQMRAMGAKLQDKPAAVAADGRIAKGKRAPALGAESGTAEMDPAKRMELGARMKDMGKRMQNQGRAMKLPRKPTTSKPPAGGMDAMDPAMMMDMGDKMMGMGDEMMMPRAAPMDKANQSKLGGMGDQMMQMGGEMGGMGMSKKKAPMQKTMGTPPPADAPQTPDAPPAEPPMQHE